VKFPNGLKEIVNKVHEKGKLAGIWVAPFAASINSNIVKTHPEYFLKVDGEFLKAGSNWGTFYTYDLDNIDAICYIKECLEFLMDLGFDFFKLDFLYASSLVCKENETRAMAARRSYQFLRDILKDKLILGCGSILSSSIDLFDYMRVGPDVLINLGSNVLNKLGISKISMKMTLENTISRSIFNHHLFLNDPDVFVLRKDSGLSLKQKEAVYLINSLFSGILLTSDNIGSFDEIEKAMLDEVYDIFMNSSDKGFIVIGNLIKIFYHLHDIDYYLVYDTKKGVMINGR
ncbi:MAG: alpha-galactosidase, partial [Bacilli bacterium]|nr:alpha-galactosidase [Bacilli bacterium]